MVPRLEVTARLFREMSGQSPEGRFDPFKCAMAFGIPVSDVAMEESLAGGVRLGPSGAAIEMNMRHTPARRRFTLCYELAHLSFLERVPIYKYERNAPLKLRAIEAREEWLCNELAAELLMPRRQFLAKVESQPPEINGLKRLAKAFSVSMDAAAIRVAKLGAGTIAAHSYERRGTRWRRVKTFVRLRCAEADSEERRTLRSRLWDACSAWETQMASIPSRRGHFAGTATGSGWECGWKLNQSLHAIVVVLDN